MTDNRTPKRLRKKEAAALKREQRIAMFKAQRRKRIATLLATTAILAGTGIAVILASGNDKAKPTGSPTPATSPAASPEATPEGPKTIACGATLPAAAGAKKEELKMVEPQKLDSKNTYTWRLETSCGVIDVELDVKRSPKTTESIVFLARKGFYDGLKFHRVAPQFVIQGGDPLGTGVGGPGYKVTEAPPKGLTFARGVVAMAKAGDEPNGTSGSQFFITTTDTGQPLDPYAFVGTVTGGLDAVDKIAALGGPSDGPPKEDVYINKTSILEGS